MSTPGGPIKLALTSYVENHLTTILKASSNEDFNTAFDNFFSEELKDITFNGKKLSREAYKKQLGEAARADNTVSFPGIVGVPLASEDAIETGFVGTFVTASFPFVVTHGEPVLRTLNASINLTVKVDGKLKLPPFEDRRRVFSVDQVSLDKTGNLFHETSPDN